MTPVPVTPWTLLASGPGVPDSVSYGMVYDASRDRVVLYGGFACSLPLNQTWEWDGTRWQRALPLASPPPRDTTAMVYDPYRKRGIIFGGSYGASDRNDLWEYDGTTWMERVTAVRPPARYGHMMAYDEQHRCVVLYGGGTAGGASFDDTWLWDGTSWREAMPSTRPQRRTHASMTYDPARGRVVMFGGIILNASNSHTISDETWEWDGSDWHLAQPVVKPPPRSNHNATLVYDYQRRQAVLFGGDSGSSGQGYGDTWGWDGQQWTLLTTGGPIGRSGQSMAYDSRRGQVVMNGGLNAGLFSFWCYPETWALNSPTPGFAGFGAGCAGSQGMLQLAPRSRVPGITGGTLMLRLSNVPANPGSALLLVGTSRQQWGSFSLPLLLSGPGAPSCALWAAPDLLIGAAANGATADFMLQILPMAGYELHVQGIALDPAATMGFSMSNGATISSP